MAQEETVQKLIEAVDSVMSYDRKDLRQRPEWGVFNFDGAEHDLQRVFTIVAHLKALPLEYLPEDIATKMANQVRNAVGPLQQLDDFGIKDVDNPSAQHEARATAIKGLADSIYKQVTPWIPFLAYQKGDVARNIAQLTEAVTEGREIVEKAKEDIESRNAEMQTIIEHAREASAAAGAAVFTKEFEAESQALYGRADKWLRATIVFGTITAVAAVTAIVVNLVLETDKMTLLQAAPKFFLLALFLTGTLWCGRIYKAFMHQAAVNRHRALALQTFQAFSAAASDEQTKNAVLLESTRSVFSPLTNGFIDSGASAKDPGSRVVEIMKTVGSSSS